MCTKLIYSMRFIDVKAFLQREKLMEKRRNVDPRTQVFSEFRDAENTRYAFLSHRWIASSLPKPDSPLFVDEDSRSSRRRERVC